MINTENYFYAKLLSEQIAASLAILIMFGLLSFVIFGAMTDEKTMSRKFKYFSFMLLTTSPVIYVIYYWVNRLFM